MDMGMGNVDEEADEVYNNILGEIGLEYMEADPVRMLSDLIDFRTVLKDK